MVVGLGKEGRTKVRPSGFLNRQHPLLLELPCGLPALCRGGLLAANARYVFSWPNKRRLTVWMDAVIIIIVIVYIVESGRKKRNP